MLTLKEKRAVRRAAELIDNGSVAYSCHAIRDQQMFVHPSLEFFELIRLTRMYNEFYDGIFLKEAEPFSDLNCEDHPWWDYIHKISIEEARQLRVLMLLNFAEAG